MIAQGRWEAIETAVSTCPVDKTGDVSAADVREVLTIRRIVAATTGKEDT